MKNTILAKFSIFSILRKVLQNFHENWWKYWKIKNYSVIEGGGPARLANFKSTYSKKQRELAIFR